MGSINRNFKLMVLPRILLSIFIFGLVMLLGVTIAKIYMKISFKDDVDPPWSLTLLVVGALFIFLPYPIDKCIQKIYSRKFVLKNKYNKLDDISINIASTIPSLDEVILLEEKALVCLKDIKGALSKRFNCPIRLIPCGSIPERFSVPIVNDWIGDVGKVDHWNHALLSDQDFLIEPFSITASYSAQSHKIEIVQSESLFTEEGYAKLRVSRCMSRRFYLNEGFLSTDTVKHSVKQCISEEPMRNFP